MIKMLKRNGVVRTLFLVTALIVCSLWGPTPCIGQVPTSDQQTPLTEREKEMLQLIKNLQERVAKLEADAAKPALSNAESQPKLESQPKVLEATETVTPVPKAPAEGNTVVAAANIAHKEERTWGTYTPNQGFKLASTDKGDLSVSIYTYVRYLNQKLLDENYTDYFGNISTLQQRQDFQIQKVQIKFLGWLLSEKLRYFLYAWTSNASQGLGAQVVLAGNLNYTFNRHFNLAGGITSLPGTRSVEGNFPFWLSVDSRLIADEFFRPSYTSGFWARGEIIKKLNYQVMLGNNLSTLGVSAAQLNNKPDTLASALIWMPTTGEFGQGFGDFEDHQKLATRLAGHFTYSTEDKQSQPTSDDFENTQIRLEDGSVVFLPDLFGPGIEVTDVTYKMADFDGGIKYRGYSLDVEYFLRWLDNFKGPGTGSLPPVFSQGVQMQASAMLKPKMVQLYLGGSTLWGKYGHPYDFRTGLNVFPWKNKVIRWNTEFLYLCRSPVGYTAVPFAVGATGPVFHTNIEMAF